MTFSKEFDLLKKFVALANNNPNEHEANVAARRVCLMLAKHEFAFVQQIQPRKQTATQTQQQQQNYRPNRNPYSSASTAYGNNPFYEEFFRSREAKAWWHTREPKWYDIPDDPPKEDNKYYYDPLTGEKRRKQNIERDLKCKTCGKVVKTKFVGHEQVFECNTCQWTAYERNKEK